MQISLNLYENDKKKRNPAFLILQFFRKAHLYSDPPPSAGAALSLGLRGSGERERPRAVLAWKAAAGPDSGF